MDNLIVRKRYNNPFPGKPGKFELGMNLFMFSPAMLMKLDGAPMRLMLTKMFSESFAKGFLMIRKTGKVPAKLLKQILDRFSPMAAHSSWFRDLMHTSFTKPEPSLDEILQFGDWKAFVTGQQLVLQTSQCDLHEEFRLEIERSCVRPLKCLLENKPAEFFEYVHHDPLLRCFLWDEIIQHLRGLKNFQGFASLQLSITLEVELAVLAACDVHYSGDGPSWFSELLPTVSVPYRNPTAQFFQWLKKEVGETSISGVLDKSPLRHLIHAGGLDESTAKQWSCGDHHPRRETIKDIAKMLFPEQKGVPFLARDWAVRNLNLWGYLVQKITDLIETTSDEQKQKSWPWPNLPFGHTSFEDWCQARYPVWLEFHRKRQKAGDIHQLSVCGEIQSPQPEYQNTSP